MKDDIDLQNEEDLRVQIGKNIRRYRQDKGLTETELAKLIDVNQRNLSRWELGKSMPPTKVIIKMAKYFQVTSDALLGVGDAVKETEEQEAQKEVLRGRTFAGVPSKDRAKDLVMKFAVNCRNDAPAISLDHANVLVFFRHELARLIEMIMALVLCVRSFLIPCVERICNTPINDLIALSSALIAVAAMRTNTTYGLWAGIVLYGVHIVLCLHYSPADYEYIKKLLTSGLLISFVLIFFQLPEPSMLAAIILLAFFGVFESLLYLAEMMDCGIKRLLRCFG